MTTLADQYTFSAVIKSKGEQGSAWKLEFDWKLPGSKFPFVLYGREWEDIEGWNVGDKPEVVIAKGSLKNGKDGQYSTDYFYDLVSLEASNSPPTPRTAPPTVPKEPLRKQQADPETPQDAIQDRIERGMAFNAAYTLLAPHRSLAVIPDEEAYDLVGVMTELRTLRDMIFHQVVRMPVAPPHYCYQHEIPRRQNPKSGNWAHQLPDKQWCVEHSAEEEGRTP